MQNTQSKLSEREIAGPWAKITIINWKKKPAINKMGNSDTLFKCFRNVLSSANGNVPKNTLRFKHYGRFVELRIGNRKIS